MLHFKHKNHTFRPGALLAITLLGAALLMPSPARALSATVSASATSAVANNSTTITFTVVETGVDAPPPGYPGECYTHQPYTNGSGDTLAPADKIAMNYNNGTCTGTFTLKSSVAGTKVVGVKVKAGKDDPQPIGNTVSVVFTAPATTAPKPATPAPATPTPTPAPTPPAAPATGVKLNDQAIAKDDTPTVPAGKSYTISGTTVANGVVTLYIFSTPRQATVTANAQGAWTYEIADLESGDHHVEATVTDPTTSLTSERSTIATFSVAAASAAPAAQPAAENNMGWVWVVSGIVALAAIAGGLGFWWWHRRKLQHHINTPTDQLQPPTDTPDPTPKA